MRNLSVLTIPAFEDNYLWLIHDGEHAVVVDPGDAGPIIAALDQHRLSLTAILLTHHHADHVGGVPGLLARFPVPVYGPRGEAIAGVTIPLGEGDTVALARPALALQVLDVPGHTAGHIAFAFEADGVLFPGDTLFALGCGRLFEGTPADMFTALGKLMALPDATRVYCAHEYTQSNARFAVTVEPGNTALAARVIAIDAARAQGRPTVPFTIADERATNPFTRAASIAELGQRRAAKDVFRG